MLLIEFSADFISTSFAPLGTNLKCVGGWVSGWVGGRKEWVGLGWLIVVVPASVLPVNIFGNCRFPLSPDFPRGQINDVFPLGPKMEITYKLL